MAVEEKEARLTRGGRAVVPEPQGGGRASGWGDVMRSEAGRAKEGRATHRRPPAAHGLGARRLFPHLVGFPLFVHAEGEAALAWLGVGLGSGLG